MDNSHDTGMKKIDLYETPIDLRPLPKPDSVAYCIEYLRSHGDYYGVQLLEKMREEDAQNLERPREEASAGTVQP